MKKPNYAIALLMSLAFLLAGYSPAQCGVYDPRQEVIELIKAYYPFPVNDAVYALPSARMVVAGLNDPHSEYMSPDELDLFMGDLDGSYSGVGILIEMLPEGMLITDTIPGSPAEDAGLRAGDVVTAVNARSLTGLSEDEARSLLQGQTGSKVKITILRDGKQLAVVLLRADLALPSVWGRQMDDGVAYLAITAFGSHTAAEMKEYIKRLDEASGRWIVDLRGNTGGYIIEAAEIGGYLLSVGNLVTVQQKKERVHLPVIPQSVSIDEPVIFLVDDYSASAAELLAAAVKDYGRALLIGERTYGKGTMQEVFVLQNGDVLKLTVAQFYSPFGRKIDRVGVEPHVQAASPEAADAAWLLLAKPRDSRSLARIGIGGYQFSVDLGLARQPEHWQSWAGLTAAADSITIDCSLTTQMRTVSLSERDMALRWPAYYPDYGLLGEFRHLPRAGPLYLSLEGLDDHGPAPAAALELIDSLSGERMDFDLKRRGALFSLAPPEDMPGGEYWLVWHGSPAAAGADAVSPAGIAVLQYDD